ncbi:MULTISPECIES: PP2C family protein-serine/threonine phosphatase [Streptomyces]|uniref:PP2C family protein-serine/threonine phosphatase n=1 Tax=Streptomyces luteosporeus TaxID=173856 RepID=A0ABP6GNJ8_9ACTN
MDLWRPRGAPRRPGRGNRALVAVPFVLILVVTVVDVLAPPEVHLGPFLVAAPAVTASFGGARLTAFVGLVAVVAQVLVAVLRTSLTDLNHTLQVTALILISAIVTLFAHRRERHERQMTQLRSVAEAAQGVVLRALPRRSGPLRIASVYLAAEAEAQIGGDLYAVARTAGSTRLVVGDVRGKGLAAVGDAALVLGAFRAAAHRQAELPDLVADLEGALASGVNGLGGRERADRSEAFVTAAVLDVPDGVPVLHMVSCGHPPPLLLREGRVSALEAAQPGLPLGLASFDRSGFVLESFAFGPGDVVLLYTDGVIEARDGAGVFYPLAERLAGRSGDHPEALLRHLREDLLAHAGGSLGDDAAMVAVQRLAAP